VVCCLVRQDFARLRAVVSSVPSGQKDKTWATDLRVLPRDLTAYAAPKVAA
jgi:hypothetical protein